MAKKTKTKKLSEKEEWGELMKMLAKLGKIYR